ncbi:MAG TPA: hypothetical protein VF981_08425 [Gemmatimonadaceae bacterium]
MPDPQPTGSSAAAQEVPGIRSEPRPAPPLGRILRVAIGLLLVANVVPIYFRLDARVTVVSILLVLGLIGAFAAAAALILRYNITARPVVGAAAALAIVVALYAAGGPGGSVFGGGEGELAALTFLAVSLLVAGYRADPGCEVTSIPAALLGRRFQLACLVFSPLDRLERRLRDRRGSTRQRT